MTKVYTFPSQPPQLAHGLWPAATFDITRAVQPLARQAVAAEFGHLGDGVSYGTIREVDGRLEIAVSGPQGVGVWQAWTGSNSQWTAARAQARYGPLWLRGHHADPHAAAQGMYEELSADDSVAWPPLAKVSETPRDPRPLDDVSYDMQFLARVRNAYAALQARLHPDQPPVEPPPTPPVDPPEPTKPPSPPAPPAPPAPPVEPAVKYERLTIPPGIADTMAKIGNWIPEENVKLRKRAKALETWLGEQELYVRVK